VGKSFLFTLKRLRVSGREFRGLRGYGGSEERSLLMPAQARPQYGLDQLYLFPVYMTPSFYKQATGKEAPWNPNHPPKYWEDPNAVLSPRRNVVYDLALVYDEKGYPVAGPDGKPMLDVLLVPKDEAASVNIPPQGTNVPGAEVPAVPVPLRPLEANEELVFAFGNVPVVRNKEEFAKSADGFTAEDRALLKAIAQRLGI
jgi:hypothetical protein